MNKYATVKALDDSKPQMQIVDAVRTLQQTIALMNDRISQLPETISKETARALEPLTLISQELKSLPSMISTEASKALDPLTDLQGLPSMISTETAKALEPLQLIKRELESLPQLIVTETTKVLEPLSQISQELRSLPAAIATEATTALEPLLSISQDVKKAIVAYEQISQAQRRTLDTLTSEQQTQIAGLLKPITDSAEIIAGTKTTVETMVTSIETEIERIDGVATKVYNTAHANRQKWWLMPAVSLIAGVLGALLVLTGQNALNRLLPPNDVQTNAAWGQAVWSKATPQEQDLLKRIVSRPAK